MFYISKTRVPVLKVTETPVTNPDAGTIREPIVVDIGFIESPLAFVNTELLRVYSLCDPRVHDMVMFVKWWSKKRNINTPYRGTLNRLVVYRNASVQLGMLTCTKLWLHFDGDSLSHQHCPPCRPSQFAALAHSQRHAKVRDLVQVRQVRDLVLEGRRGNQAACRFRRHHVEPRGRWQLAEGLFRVLCLRVQLEQGRY